MFLNFVSRYNNYKTVIELLVESIEIKIGFFLYFYGLALRCTHWAMLGAIAGCCSGSKHRPHKCCLTL